MNEIVNLFRFITLTFGPIILSKSVYVCITCRIQLKSAREKEKGVLHKLKSKLSKKLKKRLIVNSTFWVKERRKNSLGSFFSTKIFGQSGRNSDAQIKWRISQGNFMKSGNTKNLWKNLPKKRFLRRSNRYIMQRKFGNQLKGF